MSYVVGHADRDKYIYSIDIKLTEHVIFVEENEKSRVKKREEKTLEL